MSHSFINADGVVMYRTVLLPLTQAAAFARCIGSNARFASVAIQRSEKAKTEKFFVTFRPASDSAAGRLYEAEYNKNVKRADEQGADFIFWQDPDNQSLEWVFNPYSGETHQIVNGVCQCPHKQFRLSRCGFHCKHEIEHDRRFTAGTLGATDKVTPVAPSSLTERFAASGLRPDLDFA